MTRKWLALAALVVLGWTVTNAPVPEAISRSNASHATTSDFVVAAPIVVASSSLEVHRPPVPLVRNVRTLAVKEPAPELVMPDAEAKAQDNADEKAAKAAVEADGYKRVSVLGKSGNGTWRAMAYRGTTSVKLTVDGTGRVSLD